MEFTCWSLIRFKLSQNSTHQRLSRRNGCGTPFNFCSPNCTQFLFNIHLSHSNQSSPYPQKMVYKRWSLIHFNLPKNSTHQWLSKRNCCGTPIIIILQIVLSFFSRSILATQTNLSLIHKKWYFHAGVWFPSNCRNTQPTNDFQEEMVVEPLSIIVLQIVLSFISRSILATQTNLSLVLNIWYLHAEVWFPSNSHKTQPTNDFQKEMVVGPPQLLSSKLY